MIRKRFVSLTLEVFASLMLIPAAALAQTNIAGEVKDTTGAVLPGVTVEASSPALIEKVRTVVTDDQGLYKIVDLRPGIYAVTFKLPGFSTVRREGIELTTNFTATVNAELRVGALEETVTVSGQTPVVDVQNINQQRVITKAVFDAIPTGRTYQNIGALVPGMKVGGGTGVSSHDVGGSVGEGNVELSIHGSRARDNTLQIDGFTFNTMEGTSRGNAVNAGSVEEFSYEFGALSAEFSGGGVAVNLIPREGGNVFKGTIIATYTNHNLQSDNSSDELRTRGLSTINALEKVWDLNPSFGGPIKKDKLWLFGAFRYWGNQDTVAGLYYNKTPDAPFYTPDLSRQGINNSWWRKESLRLTWQISEKNKLSLYGDNEGRCVCHRGISANFSPEASRTQSFPIARMQQASWQSPVTNRLLLEAGLSIYPFTWKWVAAEPSARNPDNFSILEQSTNFLYRAWTGYTYNPQHNNNYKAALSYVTGSHAFKVGVKWFTGWRKVRQTINSDINAQFLNGVPRSITVNATPRDTKENLNADLGIFAQDQWTIRRLTLNLGIRYDYFNSSVPEQHYPPVRFVGARDFAAVRDVPNWTNVSPRLGAAYDLFGNGKTALKVTLARYVANDTLSFASANNPVNTSVNTATRTWNDLNGDFIPQPNELGPLSDANFGQVRITTRYDDAVRQGFGSRGYNWETSASLQHELLPRVSVNAAYFRRWYGNFTVTDNLLVTPADYNPFCITAPVDARLPGGGGNQICGLYDITPPKFGQFNSLVTFAKNFGKQTEVYDGLDLTVNARPGGGALLQGGLNTGRTVTNSCFVVDSPQLRFCEVTPPFLTQVKLLGTYPLPWDIQIGAAFQSLPGPEITASYVATNEQIRGSLGRDLAAGSRGTVTMELMEPGTRYDTRLNQLDLRMSKIFRIGRTRIQGNFDLYNALNASPVLVVNTRYGPAWQQPTYVLPGRLFKFGAQVDF